MPQAERIRLSLGVVAAESGKPDPTSQMPSSYAQMSEKTKHLLSLSSRARTVFTVADPCACHFQEPLPLVSIVVTLLWLW